MKKQSLLLGAILVIPVLLAASSPKLLVSWRNPNHSGKHFNNILVLAINGKAENRAEFEDVLVNALARPGVKATQSYIFLPRPDATPVDRNDLKALIREQGFDGIFVARLTKREKKTTYVPGTVYTPNPYYQTLYGYYGTVYPIVYSPGYLQKESAAQVETNFYSTAEPDGELVWTGTTNTFDAKSPIKAIKGLTKVITKELEKQDVIDR